MAKKRDIRDMQATLDNREAEKVVAAAKAARDDKVRDELMEELKEKAQASDYGRLEEENKALMDRVLELERRLKAKEDPEEEVVDHEKVDSDDETEDDLPEEIVGESASDEEAPVEDKPVADKAPAPSSEGKPKSDVKPIMVHTPNPAKKKPPVASPKKSSTPKPKPLAVTAEPGVLPQTAPAPTPAPAPKKPAPTPTNPVIPAPKAVVGYHSDGPGKAYKYWSCKDRCYKLTPDVWVAQQYGCDIWEPVWVWYRDGFIHHMLTEAERDLYLP